MAGDLEGGRIKGFKPHPVAFVGYLISHESYHQGDIGVRLTESGHRLDQKVAYGMWDWAPAEPARRLRGCRADPGNRAVQATGRS